MSLKIIWVHILCHGQGDLSLDQVAQGFIQPGLEHFKRSWGIHSNLFQCPSTPTVKIFFLTSLNNLPDRSDFLSYKSILFQFKAITPCPITTCPYQNAPCSFLVGLLGYWNILKDLPRVSLLQAEWPQLAQPAFIRKVLQHSGHLHNPPLDFRVHIIPVPGDSSAGCSTLKTPWENDVLYLVWKRIF